MNTESIDELAQSPVTWRGHGTGELKQACSQGRLPVPSPLRTVLDTFASHGSSLTGTLD
jgi:hypothetical protein